VVEVVSAVRATPRPPLLTHARALSSHRCTGQRGARKEYKAHKAGQRKRNDKYGDKAT